MRLLYYADARSPIAANWIRWFTEHGAEVHWVSSGPVDRPPLEGLSSFATLPVMPSRASLDSLARGLRGSTLGLWLSNSLRHWILPLSLSQKGHALAAEITRLRPDLVHAMRLPLEGMVSTVAVQAVPRRPPLILSTWGNDLTLHAVASPVMAWQTRRTLGKIRALHADCIRDSRLALRWGLASDRPVLVAPGNGGVRGDLFFAGPSDRRVLARWGIPAEALVLVNPRGIRSYARTDTFFRAVSRVLPRAPQVWVLAVGMEGSPQAEAWVRRLGLGNRVRLLPRLTALEMAAALRSSAITLSITEHDGTPNSLLEAMACGSFPIVGDLESLREWILDQENGLLVSPSDPQQLAEAILLAIGDEALRRRAAVANQRIIAERADWASVMERVQSFYERVLHDSSDAGRGGSQ